MERIKQALERARAEREGQTDTVVANVPAPASPAQQPPVQEVAYSQTRQVEVSSDELRDKRVVTGFEPCDFTDAFKMLRTQVLQRLNENNWNVLAVTSPGTGEGKTLTALNLAASLAMEVDYTVLLVDANLRHPSLHEHLGIPAGTGLSDYLLDDTPLSELLVHPKGIDHLPHRHFRPAVGVECRGRNRLCALRRRRPAGGRGRPDQTPGSRTRPGTVIQYQRPRNRTE
jgi:Mrp family chromosome partitioning ATPase